MTQRFKDYANSLNADILHAGFDEAFAFFHRETRGRQSTVDFKKTGGKVIYFYDTSVVAAHTDFLRNGPLERKGSYGFGAPLPRFYEQQAVRDAVSSKAIDPNKKTAIVKAFVQDEWSSKIMANALANAAFSLQDEHDLLQLPDHHLETTTMLNNASIIASRLGSEKAFSENIGKRSIEILAAVAKSRPNLDLDQALSSLVLQSNKYNEVAVENYLGNEIQPKLRSHDLAEPFKGLPEFQTWLRIFGDFFEWRMQALRSRQNSKQANLDAHVLAIIAAANWIEYTNWKRTGDVIFRRRFVFVTADKTMLLATYNLHALIVDFIQNRYPTEDPLQSELDRKHWHRWLKHFSRHYVRHLYAFAADLPGGEKAADWLKKDPFAGYKAGKSRAGALDLSELEQSVLAQYQKRRSALFDDTVTRLPRQDNELGDLQDALGRWWDACQSIALESSKHIIKFEKDIIVRLENQANAQYLGYRDIAKKLKMLIEDNFDYAAIEFSDITAAKLLTEAKNGNALRNAPDLCYESLHNSQKFLNFIQQPEAPKRRVNIDEFKDFFARLIKDVSSDGPNHPIQKSGLTEMDLRKTHYLQLVALGATFAVVEKWPSALFNAYRAISIINRMGSNAAPEGQASHYSGREAHFLATTCLRMRTKNHKDLNDARKQLAHARNAYQTDIDHRIGLDRQSGGSSDNAQRLRKKRIDLRFDAEAFAIELSAYYLSRFEDEAEKKSACSGDAFSFLKAAQDKLGHLLTHETPSGRDLRTVLQCLENNPLTQLSIATNVIQLAVIESFQHEFNPNLFDPMVTLEDLRTAIQTIKNLKRNEKVIVTDLVASYLLVGELLEEPKNIDHQQVAQTFANREAFCVSIYDPWRYERLFKFAKQKSGLNDADVAPVPQSN